MKTMKKTTLTILAVALATSFAISQTVEEGIKFLYNERVKSAKQTLEKVVASAGIVVTPEPPPTETAAA